MARHERTRCGQLSILPQLGPEIGPVRREPSRSQGELCGQNSAIRGFLALVSGGSLAGLIVGTSILLAGCVSYQNEPLSPESEAARFQERSFSDQGLHAYMKPHLGAVADEWPPPRWDLTRLTLAAFYFNPDLEVARATYLTADAGRATAAQRPNPSVSISPAYNSTMSVPSPWLVTATLDVPLETAGKRGKRRAHAEQVSISARWAVVKEAWNVRGRLRQALLDLWGAQETEKLLREQQGTQEELVRLLEKEQRAGGISEREVSRERMSREQMRLSWLGAAQRQEQTRTALAAVIGVPRAALDEISISFEEFEGNPSNPASAKARRLSLLSRADILGSLAEYEAAQTALQLEIAKQYPDIHLSPGYEFDQGDNKWGLGLGVELPVLSRNRGPILEATARRREAAARFNALQAKVLAEVELALTGVENAERMTVAAAAMLEEAKKQERSIAASYHAGEVSRQILISSQMERTALSLAQLEMRLKVHQALAALEAALQSPIDFAVDAAALPYKPSQFFQ